MGWLLHAVRPLDDKTEPISDRRAVIAESADSAIAHDEVNGTPTSSNIQQQERHNASNSTIEARQFSVFGNSLALELAAVIMVYAGAFCIVELLPDLTGRMWAKQS
jgi:hypothetical protein